MEGGRDWKLMISNLTFQNFNRVNPNKVVGKINLSENQLNRTQR